MLLRVLKSKRTEEVALQLLNVFTSISVSNMIQSENGREFANQVINELNNIWPELKSENRSIAKAKVL